MPTIAPVSDLRNYGQVLDQVREGAPVYLTKNGRGEYSIHRIEDDEEFARAKAMVKLLTELNKGFLSGEEEGWFSEEDVRAHFRKKREKMSSGENAT